MEVQDMSSLDVVKLGANIGARIDGVDLARSVNRAVAEQINDALPPRRLPA